MQQPPPPVDEEGRLAALDALQILDTAAEPAFDRVTRLAAMLFGAPIALVSLIDANRQWFKSCVGLDVPETGRDISFCGHAILADEVMVVPDALADARFADNPLVTGAPDIRFYAGAPLVTSEGHALGTLCVIDTAPRADFGPQEQSLLADLAQVILTELELRRSFGLTMELSQKLESALRRAEAANRSKATFAAGMTHDLRNPLHGILGFSQILRATPLDSSQVELVDQVTQAGQYMRKLLDDLSDLTVAESGGLTLDIGRHSVAGLLSNALELASATSALSATPMEVELEDKELAITTDSTRLLRVLVNLLSNAAKYGGSSPITLRAFDDGDAVVFEVADQGPGIEPDQLEVAFQPFERLANSAGAPGSGLGLALVRQIATLLQGTAELRSQVGVGTTAVLRLPKAIS